MGFNIDIKLIEYKPISKYTLKGDLVRTYNSFVDLGYDSEGNVESLKQSVKKCCEGGTLYFKNHIYIYLENKWLSKDDPKSLDYKLGERINQYSLDGKLISIYSSISQASSKLNISAGGICNCLKKRNNSCSGFLWLRDKDSGLIDETVIYYKNNIRNVEKVLKEVLNIPIVQLKINGDYINEFNSAKDAERLLGVPSAEIGKCCRGKLKSSGDYIWMYKKDYTNNKPLVDKKISAYEGMKTRKRRIAQFTLDGSFVKYFDSMREAEKLSRVCKNGIGFCCKGRAYMAGGFIWLYEEDTHLIEERVNQYQYKLTNLSESHKRKVIKLDLLGNYIKTYDSLDEASKEVGLNSSSISNCCASRTKTSGGYKWMYEEDYNELKK